MPYTSDDVAENPIAFSFKQGKGYRYEGAPALPRIPLKTPSECEPSSPAEANSLHTLKMPYPNDEHTIQAYWNPDKKYWMPPLMSEGRRVAFTSAYLAANGWTYGAPV